jgi:hypothetical protein
MSKAVITFVPPIVGAFLGLLGMIGLVMSQTATPDKNPATQAPLVYGE